MQLTCEGKSLRILFGPEPGHVPFGTEYKHTEFSWIQPVSQIKPDLELNLGQLTHPN